MKTTIILKIEFIKEVTKVKIVFLCHACKYEESQNNSNQANAFKSAIYVGFIIFFELSIKFISVFL